jgi:hypothetical protein
VVHPCDESIPADEVVHPCYGGKKNPYEKSKMNKYHGYYCGMPNKSWLRTSLNMWRSDQTVVQSFTSLFSRGESPAYVLLKTITSKEELQRYEKSLTM